MYPWTKRSTFKVRDKFPGFNICCYRGRAQTVFFGMILMMMVLILYRIAASETESPKVTRDNKKLLALEKMKKRTMENINEVMEITQSFEHLAWQKEYEGKIISAAKKGLLGSHRLVGSYNSIKGDIPSKNWNKNIPLFNGQRIVHLDLKGAPPKVSYYQELFPIISSLGGTGLLIEYEDMFPYRHVDLTARNAYSKKDILRIIELASHNNLEVIPLIQTFGHLEFMLKLKKYKHLREVSQYPQVVCPSNNGTFNIIKDMLDDIITLHPSSSYIHIGCDEVYYLGECSKCVDMMLKERWTKKNLFLHHVSIIARYIKQKYPSLTVLTWDDEFRQLTLDELIASQISRLIEPVVWKYTPEIEAQLPFSLWDKYSKVFPAVWIASAFKGATGSDKYITDIYYHLENHRAWMRLVKTYSDSIVFKGIFLTGWQRYDHFAILCELLPVGLPSLAVNLAFLTLSNIDATGPSEKATSILKCENGVSLMGSGTSAHCTFPGSLIYDAAIRLYNLNSNMQRMMDDSSFKGWFTEYNIQMMFSSKSHVEQATADLDRYKMELLYIEKDVIAAMTDIYDSATISEWTSTFIKPLNTKLQKLWEAKEKILSKDDWPRRPLTPIFDRRPGL
ncbi:hexosaminidase D-like [Lycorma delicatula]|uniref:hexosaminidase D-like n=1 Tax=Lycorma delicatula TaxID=130591 RepID=UPI003F50F0A0